MTIVVFDFNKLTEFRHENKTIDEILLKTNNKNIKELKDEEINILMN